MQWEQECLFDDNPEYDAFTEKFKQKKDNGRLLHATACL